MNRRAFTPIELLGVISIVSLIDSVRVYAKSLTAREVGELYVLEKSPAQSVAEI